MTLFRAIPSAFVPILLLPLAACSHRVPEATVVVIDTSLSITPRAEKAVLDAVQDQIAHMQRGDTVVVIPITGDAANDTEGRILRLSAPTQRETYDADLLRFHEQARKQLTAWASSLDPHQSRTDILGALEVAQQELALLPKESSAKLVVLSDFLEDDGTYRFVSAGQLATPERAHELGAQLREQAGFNMSSVSLCLGRLESTDFGRISMQRREAVDAFWASYLAAEGEHAEIQFDGTEILANADRGCFGKK